MKFLYTGEVKVGMGKLDKFLEFANRLGVTGLEQNQSISGNKKNNKKGKNPGLKSKIRSVRKRPLSSLK